VNPVPPVVITRSTLPLSHHAFSVRAITPSCRIQAQRGWIQAQRGWIQAQISDHQVHLAAVTPRLQRLRNHPLLRDSSTEGVDSSTEGVDSSTEGVDSSTEGWNQAQRGWIQAQRRLIQAQRG
jgi:predicted metal-dependent hydrolase